MKRLYFLPILCLSMGFFWCLAENFLVVKKPVRRKTPAQLRQEVIQGMGAILEQKSSILEFDAKIQQKLCHEIRTYAQGTKNSLVSRVSVKELHRLVSVLKEEQQRLVRHQEAQKVFLNELSS